MTGSLYIPMVRASAFAPFVIYLNEIAPSAGEASLLLKLSPTVVEDPDALVPLEPALDLVAWYAKELKCADLGLRVGNSWHVDNLGTYGMLILRAKKLSEALETACLMFPKMNSGASLNIEPTMGGVWFRHLLIGEDRPGSAQGHLFTLTLLVDLVRVAAGRTWQPTRARLPGKALAAVPADSPLRPILEEASCNEAAILIESTLLNLPIHGLNGNGHGNGNGVAERLDRFEATAPSRQFLRSLEQCLVPLMKGGRVSLDHVAAVSTLSTRTLQRRLDEEGLSFSEVLDRTRAAEARRLLAERDLKVIEIAYELGYAEPASFTRAFTRWTGLSPSEYRERHQT